jgi:hypothetical protein
MPEGIMEKRIQSLPGVFLLLVLGWCYSATCSLAADTGWMQKGVRVWYMGGGISSDIEEAYLIDGIDGDQVNVTHNSATSTWSLPNPVTTQSYPRLDQGPCWIHPQVLQNLQVGQTWMGQEIKYIDRQYLTYETFAQRYLPAWALFKLTPQRLLVKITFEIPQFSQSLAYFDAETGLLLYRDNVSVVGATFFILSEINYNFATKKAFAEDNGPHTGYFSTVNEQSGGGSVVIHSLVESRYGNTIEMRVDTSLIGLGGMQPLTIENFCFFGDVPLLTHKDFSSAGQFPPESWAPYGQHLWWWLQPGTLSGSNINVLNVPMSRITAGTPENFKISDTDFPGKISAIGQGVAMDSLAAGPYIFSATGTSQSFYFSELRFGADGYLSLFSAKAPDLGLDVQADQIFQNNNSVKGPDYYQNNMGTAIPIIYGQALFLPILKHP